GSGCPFCAGNKVSVTNSLAALFPEIAAEWHPTKNGNLTPDHIVAGSALKVWWQCYNRLDHEWQTAVGHRTQKQGVKGCPFCYNGWTVEAIKRFILSLTTCARTTRPSPTTPGPSR